jgi:hypothetical protein
LGEKNKHVLKVAELLGVSPEAARQFIAEVQKTSQFPPFSLIAKVVGEMIVDSHDLDPTEVAARVEPRWIALKAKRKTWKGGLTFAVNPDGTLRIIGRRIVGKG